MPKKKPDKIKIKTVQKPKGPMTREWFEKNIGPIDPRPYYPENQEFIERTFKINRELIGKELSRKKGYSNGGKKSSKKASGIEEAKKFIKLKLGGDASNDKIYRFLKRHHNAEKHQSALDLGDYEIYFAEPNEICQKDIETNKVKCVKKSTFIRYY